MPLFMITSAGFGSLFGSFGNFKEHIESWFGNVRFGKLTTSRQPIHWYSIHNERMGHIFETKYQTFEMHMEQNINVQSYIRCK